MKIQGLLYLVITLIVLGIKLEVKTMFGYYMLKMEDIILMFIVKKTLGKDIFGRSEVFKVSNHGYVPITNSETPKPTETPKQSTNSNSGQTGWSGSSYYKAGVKVVNQWIFDVQYNSYFYLNASGNYVQNAWSGNYYLKSGGYMAKSEWIYDKNYSSYYYLTSEGSYARNTW